MPAAGAASLVTYADGSVTVGAWGSDVTMAPNVTAVRQNLVPLVASGQPTALAGTPDWRVWGNTCAATTCSSSVPGIENQWRSAVGVTANGALVYAAGPALDPWQLAQLLARLLRLRPAARRARGARQRCQPGAPQRPGSGDVLHALMGTRLHHDVSPPGRMTALPPGLGLRPG